MHNQSQVASAVQAQFHVAMIDCLIAWHDSQAERSMIGLATLEAIQSLAASTSPEARAKIVREEFGSHGIAANAAGHVVGKLTHALRAAGYLTMRGPKRKDGEETPSESRAVDMFAARARSIAYASFSPQYDVASFSTFNSAYEAAKLIVGKKKATTTTKATKEGAAAKVTADDLTRLLKNDLKGTLKLIAKALRNSKETLKATTVEAWIAAK